MPLKFITYGDYVWAPVACSVCWLGMLLGLLLWWTVQNNAKEYIPSEQATILFISDVGAAHQWLFILGSVLTVFFYWLTLAFERWLRHVDRIPGTVRSRERVLDILTIVFAVMGGICLIICSSFKNSTHPTVHWVDAALFVLLVAISCIFQTWEYFALKKDHPDRNHLKRNAIIKLSFVTSAIVGAVVFAVTYGICHGRADTSRCNTITSVAAVFEWLIAFLLLGYFMTFILDLWPAAKTSPRYIRRMESKSGLHEKGLIPDSNAEQERSDYYASHPDYYRQDPSPVHEPSGVISQTNSEPGSYTVNDPATGAYEQHRR